MPALLGGGRRSVLLGVFAVTCVEGGAAGAAALATRELFGVLHADGSLPALWLTVLAGSGLVIGVSRIVARTRGELAGQTYAKEIRCRLFSHASKMAASDVDARRAGYMSLRFVGDLSAFSNWLALGLPRLMSACVLVPVTLAVLGILHLPFLLVVSPLYIAALLLIGVGGFRLLELQLKQRSHRAAMAADMAERMPLAPQLRRLGRHSRELQRIHQQSQRLISSSLARLRWAQALKVVPDASAGIGAACVIWIGATTAAPVSIIAGGLAALGIALSPMRDLASVWNLLSAYRVARNKCQAALNRSTRPYNAKGKRFPPGAISVDLQGIAVGRLRDFNASIKRGEHVCLLGDNGVGKSRLLLVLAGLEHPHAGRIRLAGSPITRVSPASLRRRVAVIDDSPPILHGSLRRVFTLGLDSRPGDASILGVARRLGLSPLVKQLGGLDGKVGENGRTLSRGEKLKVAAVRAMLGNPGLVLIDTSVNQLDTRGLQALVVWLKQHTVTVIAVDPTGILDLEYSQHLVLGYDHQ